MSSCNEYDFFSHTTHKGVSRSIRVYDIVLVDVHNWEHGRSLTCGQETGRLLIEVLKVPPSDLLVLSMSCEIISRYKALL